MATEEKIDWSECPLVEVKPGVQSGAPVLRGTRLPVSAIVDNFDYGVNVAEIAEQFEVPPDRIEAILSYAKSHRIAHRVGQERPGWRAAFPAQTRGSDLRRNAVASAA
jgi:uncharacterized protein (DUF433 family)